jgi:hypothetical protein
MPSKAIEPASHILAFVVGHLTATGWSVSRSDAFSVMLYRGSNPRSLSYTDCNPSGLTDWVNVVVQSDTAGTYTVQLVLPQGVDPYIGGL